MSADYVILAVVSMLAISGGVFLNPRPVTVHIARPSGQPNSLELRRNSSPPTPLLPLRK